MKGLAILLAVAALGCGGQVSSPPPDPNQPAETCSLDTSSLGVVQELATSGSTTCARYSSGQVWCWGADTAGQYINPLPARVVDLECIVALGSESCALHQSRTVSCWFSTFPDESGGFAVSDWPGVSHIVQVGDWAALAEDGLVLFWGNAGDEAPHWAALGPVAALPRHGFPTCVLMPDTSVRCWGENDCGQVGDGTTDPRPEPVPVLGLSNVVQLAAGWSSAAHALVSDGTVMAWGCGATGVGHSEDSLVPEPVVTFTGMLTDVVQIASNRATGCAVRSDKTVWCSGHTGQGDQIKAKQITGLGPAIDVAAGEASCALLEDHTVWCWGDNTYGQLGHGTLEDENPTPMPVLLPTE